MNKLFCLLILMMVGGVSVVHAQYDEKALKILDEMSAKYNKMSAFKADFTHSMTNENEEINESFEGEITVKGEMFRLKMGGQEIYSNGSTVWTYLPEANEVNIDNYYPASDMSPSKIYTAYKDGYKYLFLKEEAEDGKQLQVVDLVPEDSGNQFYKIRLKIEKGTNNLNSWKIFDKAGNQYLYQIVNFSPDVDVTEDYFVFDTKKYKKVDVIDLR